MRLTIAIRDEHGKVYKLPERYEFAEEELTHLAEDFRNYCSNSSTNGSSARRGGVYRCTTGNEEKLLFLKFDEIVYIG